MGHTKQQPDDRTGARARGTLSRLIADLARVPDDEVARAWEWPLVPGDRLDRFEILREIGRGGFGVVYEALDPDLSRKIALKTLRPGRHRRELSEEWLRREADATARLDHPAIVTVLDAGTCERGPWIAMELLRGETLEARLARGRLPPREALALALEIAAGLAHAHDRGLLHRDLKPGNVFLTESGRVKLLDLGLAHLVGTRGGAEGGTPAYMAPEQARGGEVDARADVFALGAILFEMLAGTRPFQIRADRSTALDPGPEPVLPRGVPAPLARVVQRCLDRDVAGRPAHGGAAVEALRDVARRLDRPRTLRRAAVLGAAGVFLGVVVATALTWRLRPHSPSPPPAGPPLVAVADFRNQTGDPDLDGLGGLVATALQESPGLRVLTRSRMYDLLRQTGNEEAERIDELLGREIGQRAGVRALLLGSVRRLGETFVVELRAIDPNGDEYLFSGRDQAQSKSQVLALIDRIAARARQNLVRDAGLPAAAAATPVAQLVTANLEAYAHYETGKSLEDRDLPGATEEYRKAIALDPGFALAHYALAKAASRERESAAEIRAITSRAIHVADRAPWREGRLIRAWNARIERRVGDARALYREVLARDPDDKETLALLAETAASPEEALPLLERALQVDPMYVPAQGQIVGVLDDLGRQAELIPLARTWLGQPPDPRRLTAAAYALAIVGDLDGALAAAERAALLSPGTPAPGIIHLVRGEYLDAERVGRALAARSWMGYAILAHALRYQGRRREALAILDDAWSRRQGWGHAPVAVALAIAAGDGRSERLRVRAREVVAANPAWDWYAVAMLTLAGDLDEAERYARALPLDPERADETTVSGRLGGNFRLAALMRQFVRAESARARGDRAAGRAMLRDLAASRQAQARLAAAFMLGQACAEDGDDACAIAALRQFRALRGEMWKIDPHSWMFPRSTLFLAEVLERHGQRDEARGLMERLLEDWRHADPDLPDLARARALCGRLECRQPTPGSRRPATVDPAVPSRP